MGLAAVVGLLRNGLWVYAIIRGFAKYFVGLRSGFGFMYKWCVGLRNGSWICGGVRGFTEWFVGLRSGSWVYAVVCVFT